MISTRAYAALGPKIPLVPFSLERRDPGPRDVVINIEFCGVCHSDYHYISGEWGSVPYPAVPGHEIVGRVVSVGAEVSAHRPGDRVAVGCLVDSCRVCPSCRGDEEQYCVEQWGSATYGGTEKQTGRPTYGGYSKQIVVDTHFVLHVPGTLDPAATAPLLCAGITTYSPLRHWSAGPGSKVGIVGLGGLGHMAIKLANAMGAEVVLFTTSPAKAEDARRLGASDIVISTDPAAMAAQAKRLDLIIDSVSWSHDLNPYLAALKRDGAMVLLGLPPTPHPPTAVVPFVNGRISLSGSLIGGLKETQEMLDFCAAHNIVSDIEMIRMDEIDIAFQRMLKGDVKYRFVIDMASLSD